MHNLELFATLETMKAATTAYITNAAITKAFTKASSCCTNNNKNKKAPKLGTCNTMIQTSTKTRHFGENNNKIKEKKKMSQNYNNSCC
jgi:hypothetical protein